MKIELMDVQPYADNDELILATVDRTDDDGVVTRMAHLIPKEAMEWRAAEYGIDPADTDTLLDIVLHEPHVQVDKELQLYTAPDVESARAHLLEKVGKLKADSARGRALGQDKAKEVRGRLISMCHMNPEAVSLKTQMVQHQMGQIRQQAKLVRVEEDRISRLKNSLEGMTNAIDPNVAARARKA